MLPGVLSLREDKGRLEGVCQTATLTQRAASDEGKNKGGFMDASGDERARAGTTRARWDKQRRLRERSDLRLNATRARRRGSIWEEHTG